MKKFYVACVDLFGVYPPVEECDEVSAISAAAAAEIIHRDMNDSSSIIEVQVFAVARMGRRVLQWEHFELTATVSYSAKAVSVAAAGRAVAA